MRLELQAHSLAKTFGLVFTKTDAWLVGLVDHGLTSATACGGHAREIPVLAADGTHSGSRDCCCHGLSAGSSRRFCVGRFPANNRQPVVARLFGPGGNLVWRKNGGLLPAYQHGILDRASSFWSERHRLSRR